MSGFNSNRPGKNLYHRRGVAARGINSETGELWEVSEAPITGKGLYRVRCVAHNVFAPLNPEQPPTYHDRLEVGKNTNFGNGRVTWCSTCQDEHEKRLKVEEMMQERVLQRLTQTRDRERSWLQSFPGGRLRLFREVAGLSQDVMARAAKTQQTTVSAVERGARSLKEIGDRWRVWLDLLGLQEADILMEQNETTVPTQPVTDFPWDGSQVLVLGGGRGIVLSYKEKKPDLEEEPPAFVTGPAVDPDLPAPINSRKFGDA